MLKGILALFTTGVFFHPMVLSGVVIAVTAIIYLSANEINEYLKSLYFYIGAFVWSLIYTFGFAKIYIEGGAKIDYVSTLFRCVGNTIRFVVAVIVTIAFFMMMTF